jgi:hypothetical protein
MLAYCVNALVRSRAVNIAALRRERFVGDGSPEEGCERLPPPPGPTSRVPSGGATTTPARGTAERVQSPSMVLVRAPALCLALVVAVTAATPGFAARRKPVDKSPPVISHTAPSCADGGDCVVEARIVDPSGVFDPTLLYRAAGASAYERVAMVADDGDPALFRAPIPAAVLTASDVEYLVEAFDVQGNGPARAGAEDAPLRLPRVTPPPAPTPTPPNPATTPGASAPSEDDDGAWIGWAVGAGAAVVVVGVAVGIGVYALRPAAPGVVRLSVSGPTPITTVIR